MTPERWKQVEDVFQAALDIRPEERARYLSEVCAGDGELRSQVESLIEQYEAAGDFIEEPADIGDILPADGVEQPLTRGSTTTGYDSMLGLRIGAYKIVRELGRGGMGAVYLAKRDDDEFRRRVAIKLIKRGMDTDFVVRRFRNERQILASLNHPLIARLLDGGTTPDGRPYFIMEYVEGLQLYQFCDTRRLTVTERLRLFCELCAAVDYAHQNLIIHRDLKPSNILVSAAGVPKLLDFGIAKILNPEIAFEAIATTATAMRLMTPEYASPEQVQGLSVTPASDIYSLGVLLYELLTGHRPYRLSHRSPQEIARVVCEEEPAAPSSAVLRGEGLLPIETADAQKPSLELAGRVRGGTPESLRRELSGNLDNIMLKTLSKEPEHRYVSVAELREDLLRHTEGRPVLAPSYFPQAVVARAQRSVEAEPQTGARSVAILPLRLLGKGALDDTGENYLGIGLADALITRLSQLRRFTLRPTSSVLRYGEETDPFAAGHELGVGFVVVGHLRRAGARVRVSIQLLDVGGGVVVWAKQFDENFTDVLTLEDAISGQVAEALVPQLTGDERLQLSKRGTDNAEAFEAYMRGRYHWNALSEDAFAKAITYYYRAVTLDPSYAAVHAAIAEYHAWLAIFGVRSPAECLSAARASARRAVELDDALAEAHTALGLALLTHETQHEAARAHYLRALELNPNYATTYVWYACQLAMEARFDEAVEQIQRACELDPLNPFNAYNRAWCLYQARRYEESIERCRELIRNDPRYGPAHFGLCWSLRRTGAFVEALEAARKTIELGGDTPQNVAALGAAYAEAGRFEEARGVLSGLNDLASKRYVTSYHRAIVHLHLGERDRTLELLAQSAGEQEPWIVWLGVEPQFDSLRTEPRFAELLRSIGHPAGDRADGAGS